MKLSTAVLATLPGLLGSLALPHVGPAAAQGEGTSASVGYYVPFAWPIVASIDEGTAIAARAARASSESNAERFQRGLGPKQPKGLYEPDRVKTLHARVSPAAATAQGGGLTFTFRYCQGGNPNGGSTTTLTDTTAQAAANSCAVKQYNAYMGGAFSLGYTGSAYTCTTDAYTGSPAMAACSATNYAVYY